MPFGSCIGDLHLTLWCIDRLPLNGFLIDFDDCGCMIMFVLALISLPCCTGSKLGFNIKCGECRETNLQFLYKYYREMQGNNCTQFYTWFSIAIMRSVTCASQCAREFDCYLYIYIYCIYNMHTSTVTSGKTLFVDGMHFKIDRSSLVWWTGARGWRLHGCLAANAMKGWSRRGSSASSEDNSFVKWGWVKTLVPSEPQNSW